MKSFLEHLPVARNVSSHTTNWKRVKRINVLYSQVYSLDARSILFFFVSPCVFVNIRYRINTFIYVGCDRVRCKYVCVCTGKEPMDWTYEILKSMIFNCWCIYGNNMSWSFLMCGTHTAQYANMRRFFTLFQFVFLFVFMRCARHELIVLAETGRDKTHSCEIWWILHTQ